MRIEGGNMVNMSEAKISMPILSIVCRRTACNEFSGTGGHKWQPQMVMTKAAAQAVSSVKAHNSFQTYDSTNTEAVRCIACSLGIQR